jgi:hypothetical protein
VALVDHDEVEEVRRVLRSKRGPAAFAGHEGLEDGEEQAAVLRHPPRLRIVAGSMRVTSIIREGAKAL